MDEVALAAEVRGRHGVTTRARLRQLGVTDRSITGLIARRRLVSAGNEVLVDAGAPPTFEQRVAVAFAVTRGAASFPTAGVLWAFRKSPRVPDIHIAVPWERRVGEREGIVVHRSTDLPDTHLVRRRDGITVTSPPRTAFDAGRWLGPNDLESLIEQGLDRSNFTIPALWSMSRSLVHSSRRGGQAFSRVLAGREVWQRPARSDDELRLERALRVRGFPPLVREHPIEIAPGVVIHPDLGLPRDRFFVEVDHLTWHGGRVESAYDRWRDMQVRLTGAHVERVTDVAIDLDLAQTVDDLWELWTLHRGASCTAGVHQTPA